MKNKDLSNFEHISCNTSNKELTSEQEDQLKIIISMLHDLNTLIYSMGFRFYLMPITSKMDITMRENNHKTNS